MSQRVSLADHDDFAETQVKTLYSGAVPLALRRVPPRDIDLAPQAVVRSCASGWGRLFSRRPEPTLFQRCLAVHIATASQTHGRRYQQLVIGLGASLLNEFGYPRLALVCSAVGDVPGRTFRGSA